jgi:hypothetical protein
MAALRADDRHGDRDNDLRTNAAAATLNTSKIV